MRVSRTDELRELTQRRAAALRLSAVAVGYFDDAGEVYCEYAAPSAVPLGAATPIQVGCIAKLVTSVLILRCVLDGDLRLCDSLGAVLSRAGLSEFGPAFADITLLQMLSHTHGLDGADMGAAPRDTEGRIDLKSICDRLTRRPRLHRPGLLYSYCHVGHLMLGALAERVLGARFNELAVTRVFDPCGIAGLSGARALGACPAMGGSIELSCRDTVRLVKHYWDLLSAHAAEPAQTWAEAMLSNVSPMPGYSWTDIGNVCGWRQQTADWFFWSGLAVNGQALVIRSNPRHRQGLVVAASEPPGRHFAAQLAEDLWRIPVGPVRPLQATPPAPGDAESRYLGWYEDSAMALEVGRIAGRLKMLIHRRSEEPAATTGAPPAKDLRRATDDIFFTMPPDRQVIRFTEAFYFVQFLRGEPGSAEVSHLWNGVRCWRRRGMSACGTV
jgi:CubicO group peptidase (beta-lactamase class C family)